MLNNNTFIRPIGIITYASFNHCGISYSCALDISKDLQFNGYGKTVSNGEELESLYSALEDLANKLEPYLIQQEQKLKKELKLLLYKNCLKSNLYCHFGFN